MIRRVQKESLPCGISPPTQHGVQCPPLEGMPHRKARVMPLHTCKASDISRMLSLVLSQDASAGYLYSGVY